MAEQESVKMCFACGPGLCDMAAGSTEEGPRIFAGGAEGMVKVRRERAAMHQCGLLWRKVFCASSLFLKMLVWIG